MTTLKKIYMVSIEKLAGRLGNQMFRLAYIYAQMKENNIPDIYVQDFTLFNKYQDEIKQWFGEGIGFMSFVSIHVRRGDYVNNPFYVDLSKTDYYKNAIDLFPDKKFLVFSDDTEYAKTLFPDTDKFQVMEGQSELEDFNMMASCEHTILANSSFSWWAGYLNPHPNKKVVYPQNWFTDGIERVKFPREWIKI